MTTFAAPGSATSGLQGYFLEGQNDGSKHRKISKSDAAYVGSSMTKQCQSCTMFVTPDACTKVRGKISAEGHCKLYDSIGRATKSEKKTLYIQRALRNADDLVAWAKKAGFETALPADDMHVTLAFSKEPVDWDKVPRSDLPIMRVTGGKRSIERLGPDGEAVVLRFESDELNARHNEIRSAGASWDWPGYKPHISISYNGGSVDLDKIIPHDGVLEFGPEAWAEVKEKWMDDVVEKRDGPVRGAGVALVTKHNNGQALFLKRSDSGDHAGEWCFPGGVIEAGETAEEAALREVLEETGYTMPDAERVQVARVQGADVDFTTFHQKIEDKFTPRLNQEHDSYRWESLEKPPEPLHPGVRAVLPLVISAATEITLKAAEAAVNKGTSDHTPANVEDTNMDHLALFVPLRKVDAKQRIIYGTAVVEVADRVDEIFDYASSKPEFEKWSNDVSKSSGGKSLGNVRSMHGKIAAGKLTDIGFDDERKAIDIVAKIVDDDEWKKVEEGVYTGFSIGGRYLKRWTDGDLKRYTAQPSEISLVDLPCVPTATFSLIKIDGSEELRKFQIKAAEDAKADAATQAEPDFITNDMIAKRAEAIAKTDGGKWSDYMDTARVQLDRELAARKIAEHGVKLAKDAEAAKSKVEVGVVTEHDPDPKQQTMKIEPASPRSSGDGEWEQVWVSKRLPGQSFAKKGEMQQALRELDASEEAARKAAPVLTALQGGKTEEPVEKREFSAGERAKDAKSGAAEPDGSYPIENAEDLHNAVQAYGRSKNKAATKRHIMNRARALGLTSKLPDDWSKKSAEAEQLQKDASFYLMSDLMNMLGMVDGLEDRAEADGYGYGTKLPKDVTDRFGSALVALGDVVAEMLDAVLDDIREEERGEAMSRAAPLAGLLKVGARHSKADHAIIQQVHDSMVRLDETVCKAPKDKQTADIGAPGKTDVGNSADGSVGHPGHSVNPKSDLGPYKDMSAEDLAKIAEERDELLAKGLAREVAHDKMLATIAEGVKELRAENDQMKKDLTAIRNTPVHTPGPFRVVDKAVDTGRGIEQPDPVEDEELRRRGQEAQLVRTFGPR